MSSCDGRSQVDDDTPVRDGERARREQLVAAAFGLVAEVGRSTVDDHHHVATKAG